MSNWYVTTKEKQELLEKQLRECGRNAAITAHSIFEKLYKERLNDNTGNEE